MFNLKLVSRNFYFEKLIIKAQLCCPHFLSGGSRCGFLGSRHAGDDVTVQELHPDGERRRGGAALPHGAPLRQIHQTRHSGAEGQVDPAHSGVRTHPQEKRLKEPPPLPPPLPSPPQPPPVLLRQFIYKQKPFFFIFSSHG